MLRNLSMRSKPLPYPWAQAKENVTKRMHTSTGGRVIGRGSGPSKGTEAEVYRRELVANICATYAVRGLFRVEVHNLVG